MQNQTCFLLSYLKYGDNDAVLQCFSAELGYQSFFARGIYSPKSKKKPYLFPLNLINISIVGKTSKNSIPTISKIDSTDGAVDFGDVNMHSVLFFIADFLQQILRGEFGNRLIFKEIFKFRQEVSKQNADAYLAFMVRFLQISGIAPLYHKDKHFLNPNSGIFEDENSHQLFDENVSSIWKDFLNSTDSYEIRLKRRDRKIFADSLMLYYSLHFTGFYIPESLEVLRQVYS